MQTTGARSSPRGGAARRYWTLLLLLSIAWLPQRGPATATADQASTDPPQRIISLVPAVTEMLFALGAGPAVVGVSSYDRYPAEAATRPSVGALVDPDFERILTLRPALVVVYGSQDDLMQRLERVNIPFYRYRHATLGDILKTIRELGARVNRDAEADRLATRIDADLNAIRASVAGKPRPRTAVIFGREPGSLRGMYASGGYGFVHDMLQVAGGENIFADVARENLQATAETLLARQPEVIIELRSSATDWTPERLATERAVWQRLPSLPAVRSGRIHILTDESLTVPGPRVVESIRRIAETLR